MQLLQTLSSEISKATGKAFSASEQAYAGGGSINQTLTLSDADRRYFVKLNQPQGLAMFEAEADGLAELSKSAFTLPAVVCIGSNSDYAWLVLEYISLRGNRNARLAGKMLADMHTIGAAHFGWHRDNTIGSTPQINTPSASWSTFWQQHRLGYQISLAIDNGYHGHVIDQLENVNAVCDSLLGHNPQPALLHGDLWAGNLGYAADATPVIYDPAVYYGDHEADLAMTELFGGFDRDFYAAYQDRLPVDAGYRLRKQMYNLYHVVNHLNLFGGGYQQQALSMASTLLAELR